MNQLFHCETINQFRICTWLSKQGITRGDIAHVELPTRDSVRITNPAGQYMTVLYRDGHVSIDQGGNQRRYEHGMEA